jgi:hypothetical protein
MKKRPRKELAVPSLLARRDRQPVLDNEGVVRLLRSEVRRAGGQSSWARRERVDRTMLNRILNRHKPPTKKIIRALKLCNAYASDDDEVAN